MYLAALAYVGTRRSIFSPKATREGQVSDSDGHQMAVLPQPETPSQRFPSGETTNFHALQTEGGKLMCHINFNLKDTIN